MINIARPSVASLYVQQEFHGTVLGNGTGFLVERDGRTYLITNFHVVAGRHPVTDGNLHPSGAWPDAVRILHNQAGQLGAWTAKVEGLYDDAGVPLWLEHPLHRAKVDTVALPLTDSAGVDIYAYDPWAPPKVAIQMAGALSIIGFPFGLAYGGAMAVWVQGFVATEWQIDFGNLPCFLIDSRTRPGQSGSPVIFYSASGQYIDPQGGTHIAGGVIEELVGVYSGRITDQSDLGFVWKAAVVSEVIDTGVRGTAVAP